MISFKPYPDNKPQSEGRKLCLVKTQDGSAEYRTLSYRKGEWQRMWLEQVIGFSETTATSAINIMGRSYGYNVDKQLEELKIKMERHEK